MLGIMSKIALDNGLAGGLIAGSMCLIPVIFFIIAIFIAIWVYKDAEKRGKNGALWLIVVLISGIIGLIIWLIVRPDMSEVRRQQEQQQQYQQPPPQQ
ncbi:MAG: hypothetical protein ACOCSL_02315 [Thermoplasmatota archaeon]